MSLLICLDADIRTYLVLLTEDLLELLENTALTKKLLNQLLVCEQDPDPNPDPNSTKFTANKNLVEHFFL